MLDYLVPTLFLFIGVAIGAQNARLRVRHAPVPAMLRVMSLFALGAGAFLLALVIMCKP
jgi:hypothetical protein